MQGIVVITFAGSIIDAEILIFEPGSAPLKIADA